MSDEPKIPPPRSLQEIVGSLLFASESPLTAAELRQAVRAVEAEEGESADILDVYRTCTSKEIDEALRGLEKALEVGGVGFRLVCAAGAYRMQTAPSCGRYVRAMLKMDRPNRLGRASLETLAIVAYRQPITKSEIEDIRGVDVTANIKTLMDLQLIRLVGKSELPGHPFLYGTTPIFLEHFGLASLQQLNEIDPTLQRSNPREKAAAYKKPVKEDDKDSLLQQEPEKPAEAETPEAAEDAEPTEDLEPKEPAEESAEQELPGLPAADSSDDDFVIDDTPDEFDDDDDEEDEDEDLDEEEGEGDDEDDEN